MEEETKKKRKSNRIKALPIWQPRYHDDKILISCNKVSETDDTYIFICGDDNYPNLYKIPAHSFFNYKIGSNGRILCFEVPIKDLINEGELPEYLKAKKEKELTKLRKYITEM